jgi:hypothetical protein
MHMRKDFNMFDPKFLFFGIFYLFWVLFYAAATTCFLYAVNRIAATLKTGVRVKVLKELGPDLSAEERETLVAKVKSRAMSL